MRMIQQQTQQRFEASQLPCNDITKLPWPLITEDPVGAIEKLAKSIRHTVALAEQLEHPPKPRPEAHIDIGKLDLARMSDADLAKHLKAFERNEAPERDSAENDDARDSAEKYDARERAENYPERERAESYPERERAENDDAREQHPNLSVADRVADICRALNLPQFPKGHPWREQFLLDLTALEAFADQYMSIAPKPAPEHQAPPSDHPPSTVPPDD